MKEWFVAHTRPRSEKKLAEYCAENRFEVTLPVYESVKKYRGKTVVFQKPLFPNYVFLLLHPEESSRVSQNRHVARLLSIVDQQLFIEQLGFILQALESKIEVCLVPEIKPGIQVRIKSGPLRGVEGSVEARSGMTQVFLRLDFIGKAAAVSIQADDLEVV